jgi:hypothetical protein
VEVLEDIINPFSGERVIPVPEHPDLRAAREARWGASSVPFSERYAAQISAHNTERVAAEDVLLANALPEPSNADLWKEVTVATANAPAPTVAAAATTVSLAASSEAPKAPVKMVITEEGDSDDDQPSAPAAAAVPAQEPASKSKFMSLLSEASKEVAAESIDIKIGSLNMEELD